MDKDMDKDKDKDKVMDKDKDKVMDKDKVIFQYLAFVLLIFKLVFVIKHAFRAPFSTLNHDSGSILHVDFDFNTPRAVGTLF
jgi:hypothetical protein